MRAVKVLSSCLVRPESETPHHSLWLSKLDLGSGRKSYTPLFFLFRNHRGDPDFFSAEKLKASLSRILVLFYPYAGMLGYAPDGRIQMNCTGEGVMFVEATCDSSIDEFGDLSPSQELRMKLVPFRPSAEPPCPVVMLQVTRFRCGGVSLGLSWHHVLGDGTACFHFINSWGDVTRGVDLSTITPPLLDRVLLRARSPPRVEYDHTEHEMSYTHPKAQHPAGPPPTTSTAILRISKDQVAKLKAGKKGATSFTAVIAQAWRSACRARGLPPDEVTRLFIAANIRPRLDPPLPPEYLGNAIVFMPAETKVRELMEGGLDSVAAKIRDSKRNLHDRYLRSLIDYLEMQKGPMKGPWALPPTDLYAVSWQALPSYEADFGWGKPAFMGRAGMPYRGRMFVNRNPEGDGGVYLTVGLEEEYIGAFKEYFYAELDGADDCTGDDTSRWVNKDHGHVEQLNRSRL